MDKGAHFFKCDFQVHTPRDLNWSGSKPTSDEERAAYGESFIKACRENKLDAVAITDHHDFAFFRFIKEAAANEVDDVGNPIQSNQRIVVFPGLELSLSNPPCQALLILDANFPEDQFSRILNKLSINPNPDDQPSTAQTNNISSDVVKDLNDLHVKLDTIDILKGKYIILPHVSDGGHRTLLRSGFAEHYKKMPCVGTYLDGSIESLGTGNRNILSGQDRNYGNKAVAIFQTSDSRREDFSSLGDHTTWVKWANPTAEALRQACLASESRMSQAQPELPQIFITEIDVTNSKFMGSFSLELNQQYDALIGGRGTGKSTILEYLRWGLCDEFDASADPEDLEEIHRRRQNLINRTLVPFDGEVRITFLVNGSKHIVKRSSKSNIILLKIENGEFQQVSEDDIRQVLPIQAYSQKQLSGVGVKTNELKRFIQKPIETQLKNIRSQLHDCIQRIKSVYDKLIRKKEIQLEIEQYKLEILSLNTQIKSLKASLTGMSEEDQEIINKRQKYDQEEIIISNTNRELTVFEEKADELLDLLTRYPESLRSTDELENKELIDSIDSERLLKFEEISKAVEGLKSVFSEESLSDLNGHVKRWEEAKSKYEKVYEEAKEKSASNQQQLQEIRRVESRIAEINRVLGERNNQMKELGNPESLFKDERDKWMDLHTKKIKLLNEQAENFSELSNGLIRAEVTKNLDLKDFTDELTSVFAGTRISKDKINSIVEIIQDAENPLDTFLDIMDEFQAIAELTISENKEIELPETPNLTSCGLNENNLEKLASQMKPDTWIRLSTKQLEFNPEFKYCTGNAMGDEMPFSEASAGQQATALLTVLLSQPGAPLLIDQPEDDIDNRAIDDIIKSVWSSKRRRQLIFTSHNANLVVNGDAELVICCDYREASDQTRGTIKAQGSIDSKEVKDEITSVMEGGEKAFKLRKEKYGF